MLKEYVKDNYYTRCMLKEYVKDNYYTRCMLKEYVKDNYYTRFYTRSYHCCREIHFNSRRCKILTNSMEREIKVKGTRSWCVLEENVKEKYYARFHTHNYHRYRETHFNARLDMNC